MAGFLHLISSLVYLVILACATASDRPQFTPNYGSTSAVEQLPTSAITPAPDHELVLRATAQTRDPRLCGFVSGESGMPYMCQPQQSCLWNSELSVVGCGTAWASTACLDYTHYLSGSCNSMNSRTGCCMNSEYPSCVTNSFTGSIKNGYYLINCAKPGNIGNFLAWDATTTGSSSSTQVIAGAAAETQVGSATSPTGVTPTSNTNTESGGITTSDKIAIGLGVGIGLPATIAAILTLWISLRNRNKYSIVGG
ncbi:hypothetical protein JX266_009942 [Neoarthrinium moseri]|nr:hypothetical protein JX266_009942 [Neoarthrinium moseri]